MKKNILLDAIQKSLGAEQPDNEIDSLLEKLEVLEKTGSYGRLLRNIAAANDKSNFLAGVFEATFAFQFESANLPLEHEVKQSEDDNSTIDFLRKMESGAQIYFEARLLQQDAGTEESIYDQIENSDFYAVSMNGEDEHDSIVRLQNVIVSKVQKSNGTPIKFFRRTEDGMNIVVINVSDLFLGVVDLYDCLLSTHGDPYVEEVYRRGIFGLFQDPHSSYPKHIQALAKSFHHIRTTLDGVLFLFRSKESGVLSYDLENCMVWNPMIVNESLVEEVYDEIAKAIPVRRQ